MTLLTWPARLAVLAATLPLAACGTPTLGLSNGGALAAFRPIEGSPRDTCDTQRAVAEHNSRYDSIKNGKSVVYKAPCDVDKKPSPEPKTS
jgi:hypothetical protein